MLWSTNAALYLPKATQRVLSKRESRQQRPDPALPGNKARPRSKQSLAHDGSSPSRTSWDWFPSGSSQDFSHMSFTWETRWAQAAESKAFSKSHLLMALSWSTSANKPCRKPGWQRSCCPMTTKHLSCDLHDKVESTGKDKPLRQIWP